MSGEPQQDPPQDQDPDTEQDPKDPPQDQDPPDDDDGEKKDPPKVDPEVAKAIKRRDAAVSRAQKAEEEAKALREKYEKSDEDPIKKANARLVKAEARTVLTAAGIKDAADQKVFLDVLGLDAVSVSDDGEVDTGAIEDTLESILTVARKLTGQKEKRNPRVDTRDRGGDRSKPLDEATKRRIEMLGL